MQFWPRKKASRPYARVRHLIRAKENKPLMFAGYKIGMTHVMMTDNRKTSITANDSIMMPVTVIECPPLKVFGASLYKNTPSGLALSSTILSSQNNKELAKKVSLPKKIKGSLESVKPEDFDHARLVCYTQPKQTKIGKKKPELFEVRLGGSTEEQLAYAKEHLGKEIRVQDVFSEGNQVDAHAVTKGKGFQGPVRRFGIKIRFHKSEKTKRGPGSLGAWTGPRTYRVSHAGQMGFHQRTDYNKWILKIDSNTQNINPCGGWLRYGNITNDFLLLKGSLPGPSKRLITLTKAQRPSSKIPAQAPTITYTNMESRQ